MGTLYLGSKAIYTDDATGLYWDSPQKRFRLNADGSEYIEKKPVEEATTTLTVKPEIPTVTAMKTQEELDNSTTCSVCQFTAKSLAGLAVHKKTRGH